MSIRRRTILNILLATLFMVVAGGLLAKTVLLNSYRKLELNELQSDMQHIDTLLTSDLDNLAALTEDWAAWDDTYQFMQDRNQEYLDSNLVNGTFESLAINFVVLIDVNGNLVYQKGYDLEDHDVIAVPDGLMLYLRQNPDLLTIPDDSTNSGFISVDNSLLMISISPILTSLDEGPNRGVMIFGQFVNGKISASLFNSTNITIRLNPYSQDVIPSDSQTAFLDKAESQPFYFKPVNDTVIDAYTIIKDFNGDPVYIISIEKYRAIYQQGLNSMRNMIMAIVLTSLIAGGLMIISLEQNLLSRLSKLMNSVSSFRSTPENGRSVELKGDDELTRLSIEINQTLHHLLEAQDKLTRFLDYDNFIVDISTSFINLPINKISQTIDLVLETTGKQIGAESGHVVIFQNDKHNKLFELHQWPANPKYNLKRKINGNIISNFSWARKKVIKHESIIFSDFNDLPASAKSLKDFCRENQVLSAICIPLRFTDEFNGVISFEMNTEFRKWDEQTTIILEIIANIISNAFDRKQKEIQLQLSQQFQYRLNQMTKVSIAKDSCNASLRALSRHLRTLINTKRGLLVLEKDGDSFDVYESGRKIAIKPEINDSLTLLMKKDLKDVIVLGTNAQKEDAEDFSLEWLGKSILVLPLTGKNQRLGFVLLADENDRTFTKQELHICRQATSQITLSIIKSLSLEESQEVSRELRDLRTAIVDISTELKVKKLQQTILERSAAAIKGDGGIFYTYNEETKELHCANSLNMKDSFSGRPVKSGEGISGRSIKLRKTLYVKDYATWKYRDPDKSFDDMKSTIATPLMIGDRLLGCLLVFRNAPSENFNDNDQHLMTIFAQHASIAIYNALLFEKVQEIARIDEVTGLLNRRALKEVGEYELARSIRLNRPIAIAMVDLDNYKEINDNYNHLIGDKVLGEISRLLRENVRNIDIVGRYGGDECVIIMPETDLEDACNATERIRHVLETQTIHVGELEFHVTASFGISTHLKNPPPLEKFIVEADTAMYAAKDAGRNAIRVFQNL